jgi:hypothetical protein
MARLVATITFWVLETILILGSTVLVLCVYFPLVLLKALATAIRSLFRGREPVVRGPQPAGPDG